MLFSGGWGRGWFMRKTWRKKILWHCPFTSFFVYLCSLSKGGFSCHSRDLLFKERPNGMGRSRKFSWKVSLLAYTPSLAIHVQLGNYSINQHIYLWCKMSFNTFDYWNYILYTSDTLLPEEAQSTQHNSHHRILRMTDRIIFINQYSSRLYLCKNIGYNWLKHQQASDIFRLRLYHSTILINKTFVC